MTIEHLSTLISNTTAAPFAWRAVPAGIVHLADASQEGGTRGGSEQVAGFWIARYPVTNAQFQAFVVDPGGYRDARWWEFSPQARQWHADHPRPRATAFAGADLPRTRVSWFENMAFCFWLTEKTRAQAGDPAGWVVRLPTEQEWQRAAIGDTGWLYPWGNEISHARANYASQVGQPTPVDHYEQGSSPFGVLDMVGNVWERCRNGWGQNKAADLSGYTYRAMRGGAWNTRNVENLTAVLRYGHPPRGQLNDAGFRIVYAQPPDDS